MTPFIIKLDGMRMNEWFINLYGMGDIHYGARGFDEGAFLRDVARIRDDPIARLILMGDFGEYINYTDKRFDPQGVDPKVLMHLDDLPMFQARQIVKWLRPISEKIFFALKGNHDETIRLKYHNDVHAWICAELGIPAAGYSAVCRIIARETDGGRSQSLDIWAHHGWGGGRTQGSKVNKLNQTAGWFDYDIAMMGHVHERFQWPNTKLLLTTKGKRPHIQHQERRNLLTGSYLRTYVDGYSGYGEKLGFPPVPLRCQSVKVRWVKRGNGRTLDLE